MARSEKTRVAWLTDEITRTAGAGELVAMGTVDSSCLDRASTCLKMDSDTFGEPNCGHSPVCQAYCTRDLANTPSSKGCRVAWYSGRRIGAASR